MVEDDCSIHEGFEGGFKENWINDGWTWDETTYIEGKRSARTINGRSNSNLSIRLDYPCNVSFRGKKIYPNDELRLLDNNISTNNGMSDPTINDWKNLSYRIGSDDSIITSDFSHELRWWGIGTAWIDDVCISKKHYIKVVGTAKTDYNCSTSNHNVTYIADIECNVPDVSIELIVVPPGTENEIRKGNRTFKNAPLKWGPEKIECGASVGMGKFFFKIEAPFNKDSQVFTGPNITLNILNDNYEGCPDTIGNNCLKYCVNVIPNTKATIEFFKYNNFTPQTSFECKTIEPSKKLEKICTNNISGYKVFAKMHYCTSYYECSGG
jgi:hypothetical protein